MIPAPVVNLTVPDHDLGKGHQLLQQRWPRLLEQLHQAGFPMVVNEVYRSEGRQVWLFGAGRTGAQLVAHGIAASYARPEEPRVTNAWSAAVSPHGCLEAGHPAAAAMDVVPIGADGRPWNRDDPWDAFVAKMAAIGPGLGLVHFHSPGKAVWDRPHLQLVEWSDALHHLVFT